MSPMTFWFILASVLIALEIFTSGWRGGLCRHV
jgi:membrane protein implicated in regulation of membrane protease activity